MNRRAGKLNGRYAATRWLLLISCLWLAAIMSRTAGLAQSQSAVGALNNGSLSIQSESAHSLLVIDTPAQDDPASRTVLLGLPTLIGAQATVLTDGAPSAGLFAPARAHLEPLGQLAGQPVARLRLENNGAPLRVRVSWAAVPASPPPPLHPAVEGVLAHSLANYPLLQRLAPLVAPVRAMTANPRAAEPPALKITVAQDGLYQLTYADLSAAGFDPAGSDPRLWQLLERGQPVAISVLGEEDGVFDPVDSLRFYAQGYEDVYTDRAIYWLTMGSTPGLRMTPINGAPGTGVVPTDFPTTVHAEENTAYWNTMPNGAGQDHWFWGPRLSPNTEGLVPARDYLIPLDHISPTAASVTVHVQLKGYTSGGHRSRLYLNGALIADALWAGQIRYIQTATVPHSWLVDGENSLTVEAAPSDEPVDQFLVDWLELDYFDTYVAQADRLFSGPPAAGVYKFSLTGFSTADPMVYDITDPADVHPLAQTVISPTDDGYQVQFERANTIATRYFALTSAQIVAPERLELDTPSAWRTPEHGADYIVITHGDFLSAATQLATHRVGQGLRTAVVDVQDIYDEFNAGFFSPDAIRDFLAYAFTHWEAPAPAYVVLLGDGYGDYKDNLQTGTGNYVPPKLVETATFGETPADNWFVAVAGDDILPDMLVGRLSVESADQAQALVDKIIGYDEAAADQPWNQTALLVADDDDPIFETISTQLAAHIPYYYTTRRVDAAAYPPGDPTDAIQTAINAGAALVNYTGHGEFFRWGQWDNNGAPEPIFSLGDIDALSNSDRLAFITIGNCLNGFFSASGANTSLAEALQRAPDKGAIGVWAAASLGYPSGHQELLNDYYTAVFRDDLTGLGAGVTAAKLAAYAQSAFWGEMVETFILFGDPATRLKLPPNYPYVLETQPAHQAVDVPADAPVVVSFNKRMNPASVTLSGGGLVFTPLWDDEATRVTFAHPALPYATTLTLTLTGQDLAGASLGIGPVPTTWSFTVAPEIHRVFLPVGVRR